MLHWSGILCVVCVVQFWKSISLILQRLDRFRSVCRQNPIVVNVHAFLLWIMQLLNRMVSQVSSLLHPQNDGAALASGSLVVSAFWCIRTVWC
jgi:hypothetical protein